MPDLGTGIFPNGPAQQMARDREDIIKKLIQALMRGRNRALMDGSLGWKQPYTEWLTRVLGAPHTCLICGKHWETDTVMDLDDWFCSEHCPVCSDWEAVLNG